MDQVEKIKGIWDKIVPNLTNSQQAIIIQCVIDTLGVDEWNRIRFKSSDLLTELEKKLGELGKGDINSAEFFKYLTKSEDIVSSLEDAIIYAQQLYYSGGAVIDDDYYDLLIEELEKLDPNNALLNEIGSSADIGVQITHNIMMGSLNKATKEEDIIEWCRIYPGSYIMQPKCDGASIEVQYELGILKNASTRGEGLVGRDITFNALKMQGLKKKIDSNFTGSIRGEVVIKHDIFNSKYAGILKNARNGAAGIMQTKNPKAGTSASDLSFIAFDVFDENNDFLTQSDKVTFMKKQGFEVAVTIKVNSSKEIIDIRNELSKSSEKVINNVKTIIRARDRFGYNIDGIVVKLEEVDMEDIKLNKPEKQLAVKFPPEIAVANLVSVSWSESSSIYTPIANFNPSVWIGGADISNASLANHSLIDEMDLKIGNRVVVSKRGDIIPKIESVYERHPTDTIIIYPTICSTCNAILIKTEKKIYCPNEYCRKKMYFRILNWKEKTGMLGFSGFILKQLFDLNMVKSISDLYKISENQLISLNRVNLPLAKKVLLEIEKSKKEPMTLAAFIDAFGIEGIGESAIESYIIKGFDTLQKLKGLNDGTVRGDMITSNTSGLNFPLIWDDMMESLKYIELKKALPPASDKLKGLTFVITGKLPYKREIYEKFIKNYQGKTSGAISSKTTALITEESTMTSKRKDAMSNNIPIWSIEEFKNYLIVKWGFVDKEIEDEWLLIASN